MICPKCNYESGVLVNTPDGLMCARCRDFGTECENKSRINAGLMSSATNQWGTPQKLFDVLNAEFNFEIDVCADETNHKCKKYFTKSEDGLKQDWGTHVCFMNPPYGKEIGKWTKKAVETAKKGGLVVGLLPNRTDTKWYSDVMQASEIRIIKGRLKFNDGQNSAPFPSVIVVWGTPTTPKLSYQKID